MGENTAAIVQHQSLHLFTENKKIRGTAALHHASVQVLVANVLHTWKMKCTPSSWCCLSAHAILAGRKGGRSANSGNSLEHLMPSLWMEAAGGQGQLICQPVLHAGLGSWGQARQCTCCSLFHHKPDTGKLASRLQQHLVPPAPPAAAAPQCAAACWHNPTRVQAQPWLLASARLAACARMEPGPTVQWALARGSGQPAP